MERTRAYRRFKRGRKIIHRTYIITHILYYSNKCKEVRQPGRLDKGKTHCSCWMCSAKTGIHGYSISDIRKLNAQEYGLLELNGLL